MGKYQQDEISQQLQILKGTLIKWAPRKGDFEAYEGGEVINHPAYHNSELI